MSPSEPTAECSGGSARHGEAVFPDPGSLWEQMLSAANLMGALKRVQANRGAPGVDGMTTEQLRPWLRDNWARVREELDAGTYQPMPVRRVMIPKPGGGQRMLGVPTALDRLIQQAIAQVLTPVFDPGFSGFSFGFRPGRSAHQAVRAGQRFIEEGYRWVVDIDLEKFFDRVQHDVLMARVARKVDDRRLLRLIRRYLEAGIMVDGVKQPVAEGTPQGSPLSPLLSNIMLDDLDRELDRRGHRFVRYADDVRVFVRSERAAHRVFAGVVGVVERRLKLKVNREKSSIRHARQATLLGFGFYFSAAGVRIRVDPKAIQRLKARIKNLTGRNWRVSMSYRIGQLNRFIRGWMAYFRIADTPRVFYLLDVWLRRRLRQIRWKEWKRWTARYRNLRQLGAPERDARRWAASSKGYWRIARSQVLHQTLTNAYWEDLGLITLSQAWQRFKQPA